MRIHSTIDPYDLFIALWQVVKAGGKYAIGVFLVVCFFILFLMGSWILLLWMI